MSKIFWAGDEDSFQLVLQAEVKLDKLQASAGMTAGRIDEMTAGLPPLWRHEGSTAIVEINGPVVQGSAGWMRLFGVVGYDDIAKAAIEAAMHEDTRAMLYHINSPGGDVAGIADISALINQISTMKPSSVHSSELMASAGYWLASAVKDAHITVGPTAIIGSIGVLQMHMERSKMLENMGVKATVLRSGEFKAEVNSVEALSPEAKARAEAQLADVHALFRAAVGKGRPQLTAEELADVTRGQTFLGKRSVQAGLADQVGSFSLALKLLDKRKQSRDTSSQSKGKTMKLTPEQIQAIAGGTPVQAFGYNIDGSEMSAEEVTAFKASLEQSDEDKKVKEDADAKIKADADAADAAKALEAPGAVVALLKEQLASANTKITELTVAAQANVAMAASFEAILTIARGAVSNMLIPLGASAAAVDGMDAAAVVAEHGRVKALFLEKFKVGQQSASVKTDAVKADIPPVFLARVNAQQSKTK